MNSKNSKNSDLQRLFHILTDKINLKRSDRYIALSNFSIYYAWKNIKKSYKNNKCKISSPTWNEELELFDGLYSVSDIQNHFEYILTNMEKRHFNPLVRIYINKIECRIPPKIKTGYYLEGLTPEATKLLGGTKSKITKNENDEHVPNLELLK